MSFARLYNEVDGAMTLNSGKAAELAESFYKDYYLPIDKEIFIAMMNEFNKNVPAESQPTFHKEMMEKYGNVETWAADIFENSLFTDADAVNTLITNSETDCADRGRAAGIH
jgi:hypothetical protein